MLKYLPVAWLKAEVSLIPRSRRLGDLRYAPSLATSIDANHGGKIAVCGEGNGKEKIG